MSVQSGIENKLETGFKPTYLEIVNESNNHNVPEGSESHFKVTIVTPVFEEKSLVMRHREVNRALAEELNGKIHALALHTYTEKEWQVRQQSVPQSPPCLGGGT